MLSCKVGNTIIYTFDGKYDKHTLKEWSEENRLVCPDCGGIYEYCHGKIVSPYFRHKEKSECEGLYHEPETEEHIKGKIALYNWLLGLQEQGLIQNVKLEAYIPETRQRPDLYFEKDGQRYVLEFQCSPISSEYLERHELYKLAKINDIWILGIKNFNINIREHGIYICQKKFLEKECRLYFNVNDSLIYVDTTLIRDKLFHKLLYLEQGVGFDLNSFKIDMTLFLKDEVIERYQEEDNQIYDNTECNFVKSMPPDDIFKKVVKYLDKKYKKIDNGYSVKLNKYPRYEYFDYYWNSIKRKGKRVLYYTYWICLYHEKYDNGWDNFSHIILTNKLYKIKDKMELIQYINEVFENSSIQLHCKDCNNYFNFSFKEFLFYNKNNFELPKRCKQCRIKRKQRRN